MDSVVDSGMGNRVADGKEKLFTVCKASKNMITIFMLLQGRSRIKWIRVWHEPAILYGLLEKYYFDVTLNVVTKVQNLHVLFLVIHDELWRE